MELPKKTTNLRQKAFKSLIWSAIESGGRQVVSLVVFFVLARLLNPETFGLIALASIFIGFVQIFLDQGLSSAIVQRQELDAEHLDTAFWTTMVISTILTALSMSCAGLASDFFKEPQLIPIIRYLSVSFIFSGLSGIQQAVLQRQLAFKNLAIRSLVAVFISGIVGVVMAFLNFGVWSLIGQQLSNGLVQVLVLWRVSNWRPGLKFSTKHAKELFAFGVNISAFNIINFFNRRSDDLLIGYFLGTVALGYYSVAYRLLLVMTQVLISTTTKVVFPLFSRLQGEPERIVNAFYDATQLSSLITLPIFIGIPTVAPELVKILFGEQWEQSIPVMQILSLIGPVHMLLYYNSSVIMAMGKPSWRLWIQIINTVVNVIAFVVVVQWGIVAVASAYVIRAYLLFPISLVAINKLVQINLFKYLSLYIVPLFASIMMAGAILILKYVLKDFIAIQIYLSTLILISSGIFVYLLTVYLTYPKIIKDIFKLSGISSIKFGSKM